MKFAREQVDSVLTELETSSRIERQLHGELKVKVVMDKFRLLFVRGDADFVRMASVDSTIYFYKQKDVVW